jgi:hypothetical protein
VEAQEEEEEINAGNVQSQNTTASNKLEIHAMTSRAWVTKCHIFITLSVYFLCVSARVALLWTKDGANLRILPVLGRGRTTAVVVEGVEKGFKAIIEWILIVKLRRGRNRNGHTWIKHVETQRHSLKGSPASRESFVVTRPWAPGGKEHGRKKHVDTKAILWKATQLAESTLWQKAYPLGDVLQQEIQGFLLLQIKARRNFGRMDKKYREKTSRHEWEGFETHENVKTGYWPADYFISKAQCYSCTCGLRLEPVISALEVELESYRKKRLIL